MRPCGAGASVVVRCARCRCSSRASLRRMRRTTRGRSSRRRSAAHESKSQRYEGLLQVFDGKGKVADKRWTFERLGSHGHSKAVLRFTAPAEVKGVALLVVNHPDRASDQWMWTPALAARAPHRAAGSVDAVLRHRFQLRRSRGARRQSVRLPAARRGDDRRRAVLADRVDAAAEEDRRSTRRSIVWIRKDNYALRADRELHQGPRSCAG